MAENKKSFLFYVDWGDTFNELSDDDAGKLIKHLCAYVADEDPATDNVLINAVFANMKSTLKRDLEKWHIKSEKNRESANIRWQKKNANASERIKPNANNADRATDTVRDTDRDRVIVNETKEINKTLMSEINISDVEESLKEYFKIALAYQELFIKNLEEKEASAVNQKKATFANYVTPIRLMMTSDGVTKEQLTTVWKYLGSSAGEFWKPNILSTSKLREKFDQIIIKSKQKHNGQQTTEERQLAFRTEHKKRFGPNAEN